MKLSTSVLQLLLRIVLGFGFIVPVLDRFGFLGPHSAAGVSDGDWQHFSDYVHRLVSFLSDSAAEALAVVTTILQLLLGILLLLGFATRAISTGSAVLTLLAAVCMAFAFGIKVPLSDFIIILSGAAFLLALIREYTWSLDAYAEKMDREHGLFMVN